MFEYDAHHDSHQSQKQKNTQTTDDERLARKSRYVATLMAKRDEREKEEEILRERRIIKEREKEDHLYRDKDKFVTTALLAQEQGDFLLLRNLHRLLFDDVDYEPTLTRNARERYEIANSYAARFCRRLLDRVSRDNGNEQLREFYRLAQSDKMSYIHTLAWQN